MLIKLCLKKIKKIYYLHYKSMHFSNFFFIFLYVQRFFWQTVYILKSYYVPHLIN